MFVNFFYRFNEISLKIILQAPTLLLGGFTMHRISGENVNPYVDTEAKLASINPSYFHGDSKVLDTCMGLGYTCIGAARRIAAAGSTSLCHLTA